MRASGDPAGRSINALGGLRRGKKKATKRGKKRKAPSRTAGDHCVFSKNDKLIMCFEKSASAQKFLKGTIKRQGKGAYIGAPTRKKGRTKRR